MAKLILQPNEVYLNLKEGYYLPYLKSIFEYKDNALIIRKKNLIGKFIYSYVRIAPLPKNPKETRTGIILNLPSDNIEHYENKFIYIDPHAERQINAHIDAYFHLQYFTFLIENAYKFESRTELITSFRDSLNMVEDDIPMTTLLKSDYRFRKNSKI